MGVQWKIQRLGEEGGSRKTNKEGRLPKRGGGGLGQFADLRGALQERGGGVLDGGLIPQCNTMSYSKIIWHMS